MDIAAVAAAALLCLGSSPPASPPSSPVAFPPHGLSFRWFTIAPESETPEAVGGDEADVDGETEPESGEAEADKTEPTADLGFDEGMDLLRAAVLAQWLHERDIDPALDDLEVYLRSLGADDPGTLFVHREAHALTFRRDLAERQLTPGTSVYAGISSASPGAAPPRPRSAPPPPPSPRDLDPSLAVLSDREVHERLWRYPPRPAGHSIAAIDTGHVLVSENSDPTLDREVEWPANGVTGSGSLFSSPQTVTLSQRMTRPEDPADSLAIRVFIRTATDHVGLVRFEYRYDHWLGDWAPLRTSTYVYSPDWGMWLPGF